MLLERHEEQGSSVICVGTENHGRKKLVVR